MKREKLSKIWCWEPTCERAWNFLGNDEGPGRDEFGEHACAGCGESHQMVMRS